MSNQALVDGGTTWFSGTTLSDGGFANPPVSTGTISAWGGFVYSTSPTQARVTLTVSTGALTAKEFVINTSHDSPWPSACWLDTLVSGTQWNTSQNTYYGNNNPGTADNGDPPAYNWVNGDHYLAYNPVQVNLSKIIIHTTTTYGSSIPDNGLIVRNIWIPTSAAQYPDKVEVNAPSIIMNSRIDKLATPLFDEGQTFAPFYFQNSVYQLSSVTSGGLQGITPYYQDGIGFGLANDTGIATIWGSTSVNYIGSNLVLEANTATVPNITDMWVQGGALRGVFVQSGVTLHVTGLAGAMKGVNGGDSIIGPGNLDIQGTGRVVVDYQGGAGVSLTYLTGTVTLNGQPGGFQVSSVDGGTLQWVPTVNYASLADAATGCIFNPGGASLCNSGPKDAGLGVGTKWYW